MRLSIFIFDGLTTLDAIGGYEVLARLPGVETEFFSMAPGIVAADTRRLGLTAWKGFADVETTDILYVPGGPGAALLESDGSVLSKLRSLDATSMWTVGICNGVGLLGAAGLLNGRNATTNYFYRERLAKHGVKVSSARYQRDGKYVTGAGVSASIDTALFLASLVAGDDLARTLQLGIEYYPAPPFLEARPEEAPDFARQIVSSSEARGAAQLAMQAPFRGDISLSLPEPVADS